MIGRQLIRTAAEAGIVLRLDGDQLAYDAPESEQADEVLRLVARLKDEVIAALTPQARGVDPLTAGEAQPQNLHAFDMLAAALRRDGGR